MQWPDQGLAVLLASFISLEDAAGVWRQQQRVDLRAQV